MGEIEDIAMKIYNAYEDFYFDKEKRKIYDDLFNKYLSGVDLNLTSWSRHSRINLYCQNKFKRSHGII